MLNIYSFRRVSVQRDKSNVNIEYSLSGKTYILLQIRIYTAICSFTRLKGPCVMSFLHSMSIFPQLSEIEGGDLCTCGWCRIRVRIVLIQLSFKWYACTLTSPIKLISSFHVGTLAIFVKWAICTKLNGQYSDTFKFCLLSKNVLWVILICHAYKTVAVFGVFVLLFGTEKNKRK